MPPSGFFVAPDEFFVAAIQKQKVIFKTSFGKVLKNGRQLVEKISQPYIHHYGDIFVPIHLPVKFREFGDEFRRQIVYAEKFPVLQDFQHKTFARARHPGYDQKLRFLHGQSPQQGAARGKKASLPQTGAPY
jgi:hypothetical protein